MHISNLSLDIKRMHKFMKPVLAGSLAAIGVIFSFMPESVFTYGVIDVDWPIETIVIINRLLWLVVLILIVTCIKLYNWNKRTLVTITGDNYKIVVEYGNIFDKADCKKIINFDELYTTCIGEGPADIKADTICGQFLSAHQGVDFGTYINSYGATKSRKHSEYQNQECYKSGSIIPWDDYLLLAFTKLDKAGIGRMSCEDFLNCLNLMWHELDNHHGSKSVAMPILGSGITRFQDSSLKQQQLLDMIIASYKLSPYKLRNPYVLHIVCRRDENFSLNKIGEFI